MKQPKKLKHNDFDAKIQSLLKDLCASVPFLKVKSLKPAKEVPGIQPDWLMNVEAAGRPWVWAVESKRNGQPREVRNGLLQLRSFLNSQAKGKDW